MKYLTDHLSEYIREQPSALGDVLYGSTTHSQTLATQKCTLPGSFNYTYEIPIYYTYSAGQTAILNTLHFIADRGGNQTETGVYAKATLNDDCGTVLFEFTNPNEINLNLFGVDISNATMISIETNGYARRGADGVTNQGNYGSAEVKGDVSYLVIQ